MSWTQLQWGMPRGTIPRGKRGACAGKAKRVHDEAGGHGGIQCFLRGTFLSISIAVALCAAVVVCACVPVVSVVTAGSSHAQFFSPFWPVPPFSEPTAAASSIHQR